MEENVLLLDYEPNSIIITFNRIENKNSINEKMLDELNRILDEAEKDDLIKLIILKGQAGYFCSGMDFNMYLSKEHLDVRNEDDNLTQRYMNTIKKLTLINKIVISIVDGQVMAGGIGLIAASDLVIATSRSQFSLSEMIWGLLPAMVIPYLIRRIGFRKAYYLTLTTMPISAQQALECNLIDELSEQPDECMRKYKSRFLRLESSAIKEMKNYFRKMWIISEEMEKTAVGEIEYLAGLPNVRLNIENFVKYHIFPWQRENR